MSELAEERSIGGGAKRAKIRVNAVMHGGAGAFGLIDIYCAILFNSAIPFFWQPPSSAPAFPASFAGPAPASSALPSPHARFPAVPDAAA